MFLMFFYIFTWPIYISYLSFCFYSADSISFSISRKNRIEKPLTVKNIDAGPINNPTYINVVLNKNKTRKTATTTHNKSVRKKYFIAIAAELRKSVFTESLYLAHKGKTYVICNNSTNKRTIAAIKKGSGFDSTLLKSSKFKYTAYDTNIAISPMIVPCFQFSLKAFRNCSPIFPS